MKHKFIFQNAHFKKNLLNTVSRTNKRHFDGLKERRMKFQKEENNYKRIKKENADDKKMTISSQERVWLDILIIARIKSG